MKWAPIVAMICIAVLEGLALYKGINGATLGLAFAALGGLGGYELKSIMTVKGGKK